MSVNIVPSIPAPAAAAPPAKPKLFDDIPAAIIEAGAAASYDAFQISTKNGSRWKDYREDYRIHWRVATKAAIEKAMEMYLAKKSEPLAHEPPRFDNRPAGDRWGPRL